VNAELTATARTQDVAQKFSEKIDMEINAGNTRGIRGLSEGRAGALVHGDQGQ
jgi:hypothetical protein